jgi:CRISPR/Cas system-associated exonuclease Cas4 (RecB family)
MSADVTAEISFGASAVEGRTWSVSAMRAYARCPRSWWLMYVAHVDQEDGHDSIRGQIMHAGLAAGCREVAVNLEAGKAMVVALDYGEEALQDAIDEAAGAYPEIVDIEEAAETAVAALRALAPQPGDQVLGVEQQLNIVIDDVPIVYRADLIYRRDGVLVVRDWKSAATLPTRDELRRDRQLHLGALCAARHYGDRVIQGEIASITSALAVSVPIFRSGARDAGAAVVRTARKAEADREFRPTPNEWCGSCKVRAHCPLYAAPGTVITAPDACGDPMEVTTRC